MTRRCENHFISQVRGTAGPRLAEQILFLDTPKCTAGHRIPATSRTNARDLKEAICSPSGAPPAGRSGKWWWMQKAHGSFRIRYFPPALKSLANRLLKFILFVFQVAGFRRTPVQIKDLKRTVCFPSEGWPFGEVVVDAGGKRLFQGSALALKPEP